MNANDPTARALGPFATRLASHISAEGGLHVPDDALLTLLDAATALPRPAQSDAADVLALGLESMRLAGDAASALLRFQLFVVVATLLGEAEAEAQFERAGLGARAALAQAWSNRPVPTGNGPSLLDVRLGRTKEKSR